VKNSAIVESRVYIYAFIFFFTKWRLESDQEQQTLNTDLIGTSFFANDARIYTILFY